MQPIRPIGPIRPILAGACAALLLVAAASSSSAARVKSDGDPSPSFGPDNARVTVIEYFDFNCSTCKTMSVTLEHLVNTYAKQARFVFKPLAKSAKAGSSGEKENASFRAAAAMLAAHRQGAALDMMRLLFAESGMPDDERIGALADTLKLNRAQFDQDRRSPGISAAVSKNGSEYREQGFVQTPSYLVSGERVEGYVRADKFDERIAGKLKAAGAAPPRGGVDKSEPRADAGQPVWGEMIYSVARQEARTAKPVLKVGDKAPDFALPSVDGKTVKLSDYRDKRNVVLSFVPAAFTPVCSAQWPRCAEQAAVFEAMDVQVIGITTDSVPTLYAWTRGMPDVDFPVLSDSWPHGAAAKKYGVLRPESGTSERALFVIDKKGIIRRITVSDINTEPSLEDLLAFLRDMAKQ